MLWCYNPCRPKELQGWCRAHKTLVLSPSLPDTVWDAQMEEEKKSAEGAKEAADTAATDTSAEPVEEAAAIQQYLSSSSAADKADKASAEPVKEAVKEAAAIQQQLSSIPTADKADKASPLYTACQHTPWSFANAYHLALAVLHSCTSEACKLYSVYQEVAGVCYKACFVYTHLLWPIWKACIA